MLAFLNLMFFSLDLENKTHKLNPDTIDDVDEQYEYEPNRITVTRNEWWMKYGTVWHDRGIAMATRSLDVSISSEDIDVTVLKKGYSWRYV